MFQNLDSKEINEGSLISIFNLYFLVLEYDFYESKGKKPNHSFVLLNSDKVISWYYADNLDDIINLSGDYNEQSKNNEIK